MRGRYVKSHSNRHGLQPKGGGVSAKGDLDFRGTLGVAKDAPAGFRDIRLFFDQTTDEPQARVDQLTKLTERYCVVYPTLANPARLGFTVRISGS
jgi:hypothetical protein